MVTYLIKRLIKNKDNISDPSVRRSYGMLCGVVGIALNFLLFGGKFFGGIISGSIAITADAFNNLSDAGSSAITLIGFHLAGQKPDTEHPFGHGRIEYISGLFVSMAILLMGFELGKSSVEKIIAPEEVAFSPILLLILSISVCVKLYMALYNRKIGKKIDSASMKATAIDSLSDCLATFVVMVSLLISHFFGLNIDGYCGILVALFILIAGFKAAKETINPLLGQPPEPEYVKSIYDLVMAHTDVVGIHDLIVHNYGPGRLIISLHAEVPAHADIIAMHDTIDNIEHELRHRMGCTAVIHMDPIITDDAATSEIKHKVQQIVQEIDSCISMHDFRMVTGPTHTNLIFDIVLPYSFRINDDQVIAEISQAVQRMDPTFRTVIEVDKSSY